MSVTVPNIRITKKQQPIIIVAVLVIVIVVLALFAVPVNVWAGDWSHPIRICDLRIKVQGTYREETWVILPGVEYIVDQEIVFYQENWRSLTIMSIFGINNNPPPQSTFGTRFAIYVTLQGTGTQQIVVDIPEWGVWTRVFDKEVTFKAVKEGTYTVEIKSDKPFGKDGPHTLTYKVSISENFPTAEQVG